MLYKKKIEKFNLFLKENGFQNVFPRFKYYFKVLNSEYFDGDWYKNEHHLPDNTDPIIHFLLIGDTKGYDPGPEFSNDEYYECNKDVSAKDINPLIHYELNGKKEQRCIRISDIPKRDYSCISSSSYFDGEWYRSIYDLDDDVDVVDHYLNVGYAKWYNPGPDFSTSEYLNINNDVEILNMNPLIHYELYGKKESRKTHFSAEEKQSRYQCISDSPLFDKEWYENNYDIPADMDSVSHYLDIGFAKGYDPSPDFSTSEYYKTNPDVIKHGRNALLHYELYELKEKRMIKYSERVERDYSCISGSSYFDGEWYRDIYDLDDDVDVVDHYLNVGYAKWYNPGPDFNTFEYLESNKEVKRWRMNPLLHYELYGRKENRQTHFPTDQKQSHYSSILNSPLFDKEWYENTYDIPKNMGPVDHYLDIGYAKGYDPSPDFSTAEYYEVNPDVIDYGMNALLHYELFGRSEGRSITSKDKKS